MAKVWVIERYVAGVHLGIVSAYTNHGRARRDLDLLQEKNGYESYLIHEVPFIESAQQVEISTKDQVA